MKYTVYTLLAILLFNVSCGTLHHSEHVYQSPKLNGLKPGILTVAVLPFKAVVDFSSPPEGITSESLNDMQKKMGYDIQDRVCWILLTNKDKFSVKFQEIKKTNELLSAAELEYRQITFMNKAELCDILGVDAVISGNIVMSCPLSGQAALARTIMFGGIVGSNNTTNKTTLSLSTHHKAGDLLWKHDYTINGKVGSSSQNQTIALIDKVPHVFPFLVAEK
ncbi:MAG: hypothetical protein V4543_01715 [Bacteroidota bacterium]